MSVAENQTSCSPGIQSSFRRWDSATGWGICFVLAGTLYALTANRGAQWQDSGYHILRVVTGEVVNPLGLALSHPLHHWIGRFAVGLNLVEPCFAVTLVSAFFGAVAVANTFGCVWTLTRSGSAACFAAMALTFAHTFWRVSTLAETYTLAAALLAGECWCVALFARTRRGSALAAAMLLNGLGISNHLFALLTTPILGVLAMVEWRRPTSIPSGGGSSKFEVRSSKRWIAAGAGLWVVGASLYLSMIVGEACRTGDWSATLQSALFGNGYRGDVLNARVSFGGLVLAFAYLLMNFPNLLLPVAIVGIGTGRTPRRFKRYLAAAVCLHAVFVFRYSVVDQRDFFVPLCVLMCILAGMGWAQIRESMTPSASRIAGIALLGSVLATPLVYACLRDVARQRQVLGANVRNKPYRDDYVYVFTPWSIVERSAERMSRTAVEQAGPDGVIVVEDRMAEFAVRYQVLRAGRKDVIVLPGKSLSTSDARIRPGHVVYVPLDADKPPAALSDRVWVRTEDLYVLPEAPRR